MNTLTKDIAMRCVYACMFAIVTTLSGCAQYAYDRPSSGAASSSGSGVTVYGEIDASVGRVR